MTSRHRHGDPRPVLVNLTGHRVSLLAPHQHPVHLDPAGPPCRVPTTTIPTGRTVLGVPLVVVHHDQGPTPLPAQTPGTLLVVSRRVLDTNPTRTDLVAPTDLVRDTHGTVMGCRALACSW